MSSLFDAYFRAASTHLMTYLATPASVTIVSGEVVIVHGADAIIRHEEGVDEFVDDVWIKKLTMEIDLVIDESSSYGGLSGEFTNAVAIVEDVRWSIDNIGNKTKTFQRLRLVRKIPRSKRRSGFYREA